MTTSVTPPMRVHGWNVHLVAGDDDFHFAGLYQVPGSNLITFRDVIDEMRLCFDIPGEEDPWETMAFMLVDSPDDMKRKLPSLVADEDLALPVPGLKGSSPKVQRVVTYHVILHKPCEISYDKPLQDHIKDKCARHINRPTRRMDNRYIPLDKPSLDPRYAKMPFRRTTTTRRASQSPKRRRSDSFSSTTDGEQEDIKNLHVPLNMDLSPEEARQTTETFRHDCLIHADRCAISGRGQSWCIIPSIGPGLHACHIVPQQHFYHYPRHDQSNATEAELEIDDERLNQAWKDTWSGKNGMLLMNDIRQLFEARLVSIHPDTYKIRAFVPYDVITDFHGKKANVARKVDKLALRHHYEMSCIENMAAQMPAVSHDSASQSTVRFLEIRSPLGRTISLPINTNMGRQGGDPAKRVKLEETVDMSSQEEEIQRALSVEYELTEVSD
ncbi:unnamed protein product [Fusarium graminearum]|uniref:HNH nuclease domain-containing protein n=1 Tax=Gibberella zeae TaxID=5518 RepID=A0A2H3HIP8_GIBZA|nr:hypothetical protein HG531_004664 [Fusarium graminearum]PCD36132.1 hypothetical protein FGRA07_08016 [Fusarium graminearum]CAF3575162.1 unnamed protein product [Fusarium graminearum]CAG1977774.1 unnamed protein product [Fusarium graminearum]CAG1982403.1 unnamed protein product [Fusarium graminearum]